MNLTAETSCNLKEFWIKRLNFFYSISTNFAKTKNQFHFFTSVELFNECSKPFYSMCVTHINYTLCELRFLQTTIVQNYQYMYILLSFSHTDTHTCTNTHTHIHTYTLACSPDLYCIHIFINSDLFKQRHEILTLFTLILYYRKRTYDHK